MRLILSAGAALLLCGNSACTTKTTPADNPMQLCLKDNVIGGTAPTKPAAFANMHLDKLPKGSVDLAAIMTTDTKPHACAPASLPAVTWPGLAP